ncbi:MAG TPA: metallophosphoesterase [Bacteroidales bacterium]|nr:metallophosphoesterase [Bacteroidales bacterium]
MKNLTRKFFALALSISFFIYVFGKSPKEQFTFIQLTDPQMGFISGNKNCDEEIRLYTKTVGYINQIKPKFVVITGDFVNNRTDSVQIDAFKKITSSISKKIPVYLIPGNHDISMKPTTETLNLYFQNYGMDRFDFVCKKVQFIGINSCLIKSGTEQEKLQLDWLKVCLAKGPVKMRKVVFTHQPFYIRSMDEADSYETIPQPERSEYFQLLKASGVIAVFSGHYHNNAKSTYQGIDLVVSSAVGKTMGKVGSGFRVIKVYRDSIANTFVELSKIK